MAVAKGPDEEELDAVEEALLAMTLTLRTIARGHRNGRFLNAEAATRLARVCLEGFGIGWRTDGK